MLGNMLLGLLTSIDRPRSAAVPAAAPPRDWDEVKAVASTHGGVREASFFDASVAHRASLEQCSPIQLLAG